MDLIITNASVHALDFCWRLPGGSGVRTEHIPVGAEVRLSGEFTPTAVESIVEHHKKYGLARLDEIDRVRGLWGVCYSTRKGEVQ